MSRIYGSKNGIRQPRKSPPRDRKCIDCDNLILRRSPRCRSCAMKAKAPLSDEAREKIRNSLKGNKNWNWKGGSSKRAINERKASRPRPLNCEVCDRPEVELKRGLFYDHNHQTDKFRGWICSDCNLALGFAKDSVEIMKKLIKYVNKNDFNKPESNVEVGRHVLKGMLNGIARVSKAVRETYGGMGMNAVIEREISPGHEIVNDAQSIIQAIQVSDPLEKRGLNFLKELSDKANKDSGDGRKTTCILAQEILQGGYDANINGNQLKKELYDLIPFIEQEIDKQKKTIDIANVKDVATIAGESEEIGNLIQEIYLKIGKEGVIHVESSGTYQTSYEFIDAVRFANGTGFISNSMVHGDDSKAIYEKPLILVTKRKITKESEIDPILQLAKREEKDLVIMADDMDNKIVNLLIDLHKTKVMNICIIKPSVLWKNFVFEDFAKCIGATIVSDEEGVDFKNLGLSHLGTCAKIVIDEEKTDLMGTKDISDHIALLQSKGDNDSLLRVQWLNTKTAIIKLGAGSESELSYLRLKTQDAVNSTRLALEDGVVRGGGVCLNNIAQLMPDTKTGTILNFALKAPCMQIAHNTAPGDVFIIPANVVDSARVVKNAIRNAINLAGIILTTGVVINLPEKSFEERQLEILSNKRTPF